MKACLYLRSSKDRNDVSIDAQRHELSRLAESLPAPIVAEFVDVVMSGADSRRPGFVALKAAIADPARGWDVLLMLDTSRLARDEDGYEPALVHRECRRAGIRIIYAKLPSTGTAVDVVMLGTVRSFDAYHRIISREKGLAGMRENVRQGFRAGGRAPVGYRLEHFPVGAIRDGAPVLKSRLVIDADTAPAIARYLADRAAGIPRTEARRNASLRLAHSTLVGIEWRALTYAGHTVWNMEHPHERGGYHGGVKRRPREDWAIGYDTHPPLIATEQAERILEQLAANPWRRRSPRMPTLLGGLLVDPAGRAWHGYSEDGGCYRVGKGRRIGMRRLDGFVVSTVVNQLRAKGLAALLAKAARTRATRPVADDKLTALNTRANATGARIDKLLRMVTEVEHPRPLLEKIDELEKDRAAIAREQEALRRQAAEAKETRELTEDKIARLLERLAGEFHRLPADAVKRLLASVLDRAELDPRDLTLRLYYRISTTSGANVATPRGRDATPGAVIRFVRVRKVA